MLEHYNFPRIGRKKALSSAKIYNFPNTTETLTGYVQGKTASDIEERLANALDERSKNYFFRYVMGGEGKPGWHELDFLVIDGGYYPVEVDGDFTHKGQQSADALKDSIVMEYLKAYNPFPVRRVVADQLISSDSAYRWVMENFG